MKTHLHTAILTAVISQLLHGQQLPCPANFELHGKYCYRYLHQFKPWQQAQNDCESMGAFLIEPKTLAECDFLQWFKQDKTPQGSGWYANWIGATDSAKQYEWKWTSGEALRWGNWGTYPPAQPNGGSAEDCVIMNPTWSDVRCSGGRVYICQSESCAKDNGGCQNGGVCSVDNSGRVVCACQIGYSGNRCQIDIDDCASSPCQNGGQCNDGIDSYSCTCSPGFTDGDCSKRSSCGPPQPVPNGSLNCSSDSHLFEDICSLQCNQGFIPQGAETTTCQDSLQWSTIGNCIEPRSETTTSETTTSESESESSDVTITVVAVVSGVLLLCCLMGTVYAIKRKCQKPRGCIDTDTTTAQSQPTTSSDATTHSGEGSSSNGGKASDEGKSSSSDGSKSGSKSGSDDSALSKDSRSTESS